MGIEGGRENASETSFIARSLVAALQVSLWIEQAHLIIGSDIGGTLPIIIINIA